MPNVRVRVESVSNDELDSQKVGQEVVGKDVTKERLAVASIFAHQALTMGKQIVSFAISNVGNFTGDSVKQDRIEQAVNILGDIGTIGMGAMAGGWVGAIIGTLGVATKYTLDAISTNQQEKHTERKTELIRERSGNSLTNGSRTGV